MSRRRTPPAFQGAKYRLSPRGGRWRDIEEVIHCQPRSLRLAVIRYLQADDRLVRKPQVKKPETK